jgi:hypothetical protein
VEAIMQVGHQRVTRPKGGLDYFTPLLGRLNIIMGDESINTAPRERTLDFADMVAIGMGMGQEHP